MKYLVIVLFFLIVLPIVSIAKEKEYEDIIMLLDGTEIHGLILKHKAGKSYTIIDYEGVKHTIVVADIEEVKKGPKTGKIPSVKTSNNKQNNPQAGIFLSSKGGFYVHAAPSAGTGGVPLIGIAAGMGGNRVSIGVNYEKGYGYGSYTQLNFIALQTRILFSPESDFSGYFKFELGSMNIPGNSGFSMGASLGFDNEISKYFSFWGEAGYRGFSALSSISYYGYGNTVVQRTWWNQFGLSGGIRFSQL